MFSFSNKKFKMNRKQVFKAETSSSIAFDVKKILNDNNFTANSFITVCVLTREQNAKLFEVMKTLTTEKATSQPQVFFSNYGNIGIYNPVTTEWTLKVLNPFSKNNDLSTTDDPLVLDKLLTYVDNGKKKQQFFLSNNSLWILYDKSQSKEAGEYRILYNSIYRNAMYKYYKDNPTTNKAFSIFSKYCKAIDNVDDACKCMNDSNDTCMKTLVNYDETLYNAFKNNINLYNNTQPNCQCYNPYCKKKIDSSLIRNTYPADDFRCPLTTSQVSICNVIFDAQTQGSISVGNLTTNFNCQNVANNIRQGGSDQSATTQSGTGTSTSIPTGTKNVTVNKDGVKTTPTDSKDSKNTKDTKDTKTGATGSNDKTPKNNDSTESSQTVITGLMWGAIVIGILIAIGVIGIAIKKRNQMQLQQMGAIQYY